MDKIVDCVSIANEILEECRRKVEKYDSQGKPRRRLLIVSNDDEASKVYVRNKVKACEKVGIMCCVTPSPMSQDLYKYNGVIIQLPTNKPKLINAISVFQDVDGFHDLNIGLLNNGKNPAHLPCTPKGIMTMLEHEKYDLDGKHVVIVGRSNIVGRPLARMMERANATVTLCHSHTADLERVCSMADVLVVAIGKPRYIKAKHVKEGAFVIDVGINRVDGKLCGDVDFEDVYEKCGRITTVPRGVGLLTVSSLMQNMMNTY